MALVRLNVKTARPNDCINFITALAGPREAESLKLLHAIAAQFSSIMKEEGLVVNSFLEVEWNTEFAGKNWNSGERVELVLKRPDGSFAPYTWLLQVMAHELAHIRHMHHLRSFQKENSNFLSRVMVLFNSGKTGGGFWSQGRSLLAADVAPLGAADIPHFICNARNAGGGGKKKRSKPRNDKPRRQAGPSKSMGRQTKIARKPGGRVTRVGAFPDAEGGAQKLSDDPNKSSFRKKAGAKSAVAARADAAQKRMDDAKKLARRGAKLNNKGKQVGAQVISSDEDEEIDQLASDSEDEEEEGSEEDELRQIEDDEGEYLKRELAKYLSHAGAGEVAEGYESDSDIEIIELPIKNAVKKQPIGNAIASGSGSNSKKWTCSACTLQNSMSSSRCDVCDANRP